MKKIVLTLLLTACVSVSAYGTGASVTGLGIWAGKVHEYANPFDPNFDRNADSATITRAPGWDVGRSLAAIVNRMDGRDESKGSGRVQKANGGGESTWITFQAAQPFTVGTIIVSQRVWYDFASAMPYTLKFGNGGAVADWDNIAAVPTSDSFTAAGTPDWKKFEIAHFSGTYNSFRIDATAANYNNTGYFDINEVVILPDVLHRVVPTVSASSTGLNANPAKLVSMGNYDLDGWWSADGVTGNVTATFTFDQPQRIDAIVFWSYENHDACFTLQYTDLDSGLPVEVADIRMPKGDALGCVLPVQLDVPLYAKEFTLSFDLAPGQTAALREVMFFEKPIPEPATMSLLALGGLAMLRRRRGA